MAYSDYTTLNYYEMEISMTDKIFEEIIQKNRDWIRQAGNYAALKKSGSFAGIRGAYQEDTAVFGSGDVLAKLRALGNKVNVNGQPCDEIEVQKIEEARNLGPGVMQAVGPSYNFVVCY